MTSVNICFRFAYPTRFTPCTACPRHPNPQECYRNLEATVYGS